MVFFHSSSAQDHPKAAIRTIDGDVHPAGLCPAQPATADYALALAEDVDRRFQPDVLDVEAIGWTTYPHHAHAKVGVSVSPVLGYLLSICWCARCADLAPAGLFRALRRRARLELDGHARPETLGEFFASNPDVAAFQAGRERTIVELVRALRPRVRAAVHVVYAGEPAVQGLDVQRLGTVADRLTVVTSTADAAACRAIVRAAATVVIPERVVAGVSILEPPITSEDQFAGLLDAVCAEGVRSLSVYNASLAYPARLAWCRSRLSRWAS
jgi:hypothetical protein